MTSPLFNDALWPITSNIGFFRAHISELVQAWRRWKGCLLQASGFTLTETAPRLPLESVLRQLEPLSMPQAERYAFIQCDGGWCAYFDNHRIGTDLGGPLSVLSGQLRSEAVRICEDGQTDARGVRRSTAVMFELHSGQSGSSTCVRAVALLREGGWRWDNHGAPLPFEDAGRYSERSVAKRFNLQMLDGYAKALGVRPFDPTYYRSESPASAIIVHVHGVHYHNQRRWSILEAQAEAGRVQTK